MNTYQGLAIKFFSVTLPVLISVLFFAFQLDARPLTKQEKKRQQAFEREIISARNAVRAADEHMRRSGPNTRALRRQVKALQHLNKLVSTAKPYSPAGQRKQNKDIISIRSKLNKSAQKLKGINRTLQDRRRSLRYQIEYPLNKTLFPGAGRPVTIPGRARPIPGQNLSPLGLRRLLRARADEHPDNKAARELAIDAANALRDQQEEVTDEFNSVKDMNDKLDQLEEKMDSGDIGRYVADKFGRYLNSALYCSYQERCGTGDKTPISEEKLKEIFPTVKTLRSSEDQWQSGDNLNARGGRVWELNKVKKPLTPQDAKQ